MRAPWWWHRLFGARAPAAAVVVQDVARERGAAGFVGREAYLAFLRANLEKSARDSSRKYITCVFGPAVVGKSEPLRRFRRVAEEAHLSTT